MPARNPRRPPTPLSATKLEELAISYVGRFATSRHKLIAYLRRKLRERGWDGPSEPDLAGLSDRLVSLGYIDDRAFALAKARSLTSRGYGERRVAQTLTMSGIGEEDGAPARTLAEEEALEAALRFAKRRSLGPYAVAEMDPKARERALAAMVRAGHRFGLAKAIIDIKPGSDTDLEDLKHGAPN